MLLLNLSLLIDVTFSTPTGDDTHGRGIPSPGILVIQLKPFRRQRPRAAASLSADSIQSGNFSLSPFPTRFLRAACLIDPRVPLLIAIHDDIDLAREVVFNSKQCVAIQFENQSLRQKARVEGAPSSEPESES
jgi:hypothetical protein